MQIKTYRFYIGVDCGVKTGLASWCKPERQFYSIETVPIHIALTKIRNWNEAYRNGLFVRVEDARQATFYRQADIHKAQGAGSVKRDASIWEDFLKDLGIPFEMVRPNKQLTKMSADAFRRTTKFTGTTDNHGRDAAMLVYGI